MRCYNAAMSKPFQFSMGRMLLGVALFFIAAALFLGSQHAWLYDIRFPCVAFSALFLGAAIGMIFRRTLGGVVIGSLVIACWIVLAALLS
jgi:hypothetical protein